MYAEFQASGAQVGGAVDYVFVVDEKFAVCLVEVSRLSKSSDPDCKAEALNFCIVRSLL